MFCGAAGLTREHVWPQWLIRELRERPIRVWRGRGNEWIARDLAMTARFVCAHCNNGWMSRLEAAVRPILLPLFVATTDQRIDAAGQSMLARWAVKTAMVFEYVVRRREPYYSADERRIFAAPPHEPPAETIVRIASYGGQLRAAASPGVRHLVTMGGEEGRGQGGEISINTLIVRPVVLQVESSRYAGSTGNQMLLLPTPLESRSEWIYPRQHAAVDWPPGRPLTDTELNVFSRNVSPVITRGEE